MIEAVSRERWQQAQDAEIAVVSYDYEGSRRSARFILDCLDVPEDYDEQTVAEIGCGPYPAVSFCANVYGVLYEPLYFSQLRTLMAERMTMIWIQQAFEDAATLPRCDEVFLFNCLQHVREPELVVSRCKQIAPIIRFFEPIDYPTCVYHPHTFTEADFKRWFGDSVKRYKGGSVAGFHESDCAYGTWRK